MPVRRRALLAAFLMAAPAARAEKLDKDSKKWLDEVSAIVLPEESKTYSELKDRGERIEFEKIFWARRDPDLGTAENEYQQDFAKRKAAADARFTIGGTAGSQTGCGRLLILLGEPDSVKEDNTGGFVGELTAPGAQPSSHAVQRSSANAFDPIAGKVPTIWSYKDRKEVSFKGGAAEIQVDARCALHPAVTANLDRIAGGRVVNPGLAYKVVGGKITRLADLLPKATPAQEMLKSGREDVRVAEQLSYYRAQGPTAVIGLVEADASALTTKDVAGAKAAEFVLAAQAVADDGRVAASDERPLTAPLDGKGAVQASYRLFVRPGHYTIKAGLLDAKTGKGGMTSATVDVPDLNGAELSTGTLMIVQDIVEGVTPNAADPLDAFVLGSVKLVPRFSATFAKGEPAHFFYTVNGTLDEATGKSDVTLSLQIAKKANGTVVASAPAQSFTDAHVVGSIGPVALTYEPGAYVARLKVKDNVAKKDAVIEQAFEIK